MAVSRITQPCSCISQYTPIDQHLGIGDSAQSLQPINKQLSILLAATKMTEYKSSRKHLV